MDRVEDLLARLDVPEQHVPLARSLIGRAVELGGSDDEILAAAKLEDLGPLLVDLAMRPPGDTLTLDQFAERSGLDRALVHRIWSEFGLPRDGPALPPGDQSCRMPPVRSAGERSLTRASRPKRVSSGCKPYCRSMVRRIDVVS